MDEKHPESLIETDVFAIIIATADINVPSRA
jgi:hypothetical protein